VKVLENDSYFLPPILSFSFPLCFFFLSYPLSRNIPSFPLIPPPTRERPDGTIMGKHRRRIRTGSCGLLPPPSPFSLLFSSLFFPLRLPPGFPSLREGLMGETKRRYCEDDQSRLLLPPPPLPPSLSPPILSLPDSLLLFLEPRDVIRMMRELTLPPQDRPSPFFFFFSFSFFLSLLSSFQALFTLAALQGRNTEKRYPNASCGVSFSSSPFVSLSFLLLSLFPFRDSSFSTDRQAIEVEKMITGR